MARRFAISAVLVAFAPFCAMAADSAVILAYPRIGGGPAISTVRTEQFDAHLKELQGGAYKVMPLGEIVRALAARRELPERAVALTFDSGHRSIHQIVWPKLRAAKLPFTVFIATDRPGNNPDYLAWHQLSEMAAAGVEIGVQGTADLRLANLPVDKAAADIAKAAQKVKDELGKSPAFFAYPYGEFSRAVAEEVARAGFAAGFGQHSGVAHASLGLFGLPRFALSQTYGDLERLRTIAAALPIPIRDLVPGDALVSEVNPPALGFTVAPPIGKLDALGCFPSDGGRASVEVLGDARVEVRFAAAFPAGRVRVNCTMVGADGRWRWLGIPFVVVKP